MAKKGICKERLLHSLSDFSGRYFTPSSPVQSRIMGPSNDERDEGRGGGANDDDVGLSHRCRVGIIRVGRKKASKGLEIFCLECGRK